MNSSTATMNNYIPAAGRDLPSPVYIHSSSQKPTKSLFSSAVR